jgi:hypothetical protein
MEIWEASCRGAQILARGIKNNPVGAELIIQKGSQHGIWLLAASSTAQNQSNNKVLKQSRHWGLTRGELSDTAPVSAQHGNKT